VCLRFGDENGISTLTFEHSCAYLVHCEAKSFTIEMIWKSELRDKFLAKLREVLPFFALWSAVINSAVVTEASRTRFYIIGVDVTKAGSCRSRRQ